MGIGMDWLDKPGGLWAVRRAVSEAWPLANVPAEISSWRALVDFFPSAEADVIDEKPPAVRAVRVESDAKRIAKAGGVDLLTLVCLVRSPSRVITPLCAVSRVRVVCGNAAVTVDAQNLAVQCIQPPRRMGVDPPSPTET
jgi:hypothetical protein